MSQQSRSLSWYSLVVLLQVSILLSSLVLQSETACYKLEDSKSATFNGTIVLEGFANISQTLNISNGVPLFVDNATASSSVVSSANGTLIFSLDSQNLYQGGQVVSVKKIPYTFSFELAFIPPKNAYTRTTFGWKSSSHTIYCTIFNKRDNIELDVGYKEPSTPKYSFLEKPHSIPPATYNTSRPIFRIRLVRTLGGTGKPDSILVFWNDNAELSGSETVRVPNTTFSPTEQGNYFVSTSLIPVTSPSNANLVFEALLIGTGDCIDANDVGVTDLDVPLPWKYTRFGDDTSKYFSNSSVTISQGGESAILVVTPCNDCGPNIKATGAMLETKNRFGYGRYSFVILTHPAIVTSFYITAGSATDQPVQFIQMSIDGQYPSKVQITMQNHEAVISALVDIEIDTSEGSTSFWVEWRQDMVLWGAEGKLFATADNAMAVPFLPGKFGFKAEPNSLFTSSSMPPAALVSDIEYNHKLSKCPADCSGHGKCDPHTYTCKCNDGYKGVACHIGGGGSGELIPKLWWIYIGLGVVGVCLCIAVIAGVGKYSKKKKKKKSKRALAEQRARAPTGEVTLVFTDVKNSTQLWELYPAYMKIALSNHNDLFRRMITKYRGYEVKTEGDAFMIAFRNPRDALKWAFSVQIGLLEVQWPRRLLQHEDASVVRLKGRRGFLYRGLRVRMGIHCGRPLCSPDPITGRMDYFGPMVNRSARVSGVAYGGQIVVSEAAWEQIRRNRSLRKSLVFKELGEFWLKGLESSERLYQVLPKRLAMRKFPPPEAPREPVDNAGKSRPATAKDPQAQQPAADVPVAAPRVETAINIMAPASTMNNDQAAVMTKLLMSIDARLAEKDQVPNTAGNAANPPAEATTGGIATAESLLESKMATLMQTMQTKWDEQERRRQEEDRRRLQELEEENRRMQQMLTATMARKKSKSKDRSAEVEREKDRLQQELSELKRKLSEMEARNTESRLLAQLSAARNTTQGMHGRSAAEERLMAELEQFRREREMLSAELNNKLDRLHDVERALASVAPSQPVIIAAPAAAPAEIYNTYNTMAAAASTTYAGYYDPYAANAAGYVDPYGGNGAYYDPNAGYADQNTTDAQWAAAQSGYDQYAGYAQPAGGAVDQWSLQSVLPSPTTTRGSPQVQRRTGLVTGGSSLAYGGAPGYDYAQSADQDYGYGFSEQQQQRTSVGNAADNFMGVDYS